LTVSRLAAATSADRIAQVDQPGQLRLVWRRFSRHRLAVFGASALLIVVLLALLGPLLAPPLFVVDPFHAAPPVIYAHRDQAPSFSLGQWTYLMGTDANGNAVLAYVLDGARSTLAIGIVGSALAAVIGALIGATSGYIGGVLDSLLMRVADIFLAVPLLPLFVLLSLSPVQDQGLQRYIVLFGFATWPSVARLVRGYFLSLKEREFAESARAVGVSTPRIIVRHLLPNALDVVIVAFTLNTALFIVIEATLDLLNVGPDTVTWGKELAITYYAGGVISGYWWQFVFPGGALLVTVLAINFLGDGLRDALDVTAGPFIVADVVEPAAETQRGGASRWVQRVGGVPMRGLTLARSGWGIATSPVMRRTRTAVLRVAPATGRTWLVPKELGPSREIPLLLAVPLPVVCLLLVSLACLLGNAHLAYAPNYNPPTQVTSIDSASDYAAWPLAKGGWDILGFRYGDLWYREVDDAGRTSVSSAMARGESNATQPALAESDGHLLGAWVSATNDRIQAAFLGKHRPKSFALNPTGGIVEHPSVVALPARRFGVLFDWQRDQNLPQATFDIYLASVSDGARTRPRLIRLVRSANYGLLPRGALDGSGALDTMYLERTGDGSWTIDFQRFRPSGTPLAGAVPLGTVSYQVRRADASIDPTGVPLQWGMDLQAAGDGSVWGVWRAGTSIHSFGNADPPEGATTINVAHWSASGGILLPPTVVEVDPSYETDVPSLAMAVTPAQEALYFTYPGDTNFPQLDSSGNLVPGRRSYGGSGHVLVNLRLDTSGRPIGYGRVAYDAGGEASNPRAGTIAGRAEVLWQKFALGGDVLEGSVYHPARSPDLLTRLGLNIGNVWANLVLIAFGALGIGIVLTAINAFLLLPLIPVWMVARRLGARLCWPVYGLTIGLLMVYGLLLPPYTPAYLLGVRSLVGALALDPLDRSLIAIGALVASYWLGAVVLRRQEAWLRAAAMGVIALSFILVIYAELFIQSQLGRI